MSCWTQRLAYDTCRMSDCWDESGGLCCAKRAVHGHMTVLLFSQDAQCLRVAVQLARKTLKIRLLCELQ